MPAGNAIARRLDRLHDQWVEFSLLPDARLLRWLRRPDEYRMVEAFLQKESDDAAGELPDLFLRFAEPFDDVNGYGNALLQSLEQQYSVAREELAADGIAAEWKPAPLPAGTHSLSAFLAAAHSLQAHYADDLDQLVLVLTPASISDEGQWQRWLLAAARGLQPTVRMILLDDADSPTLNPLVEQAGPLVHTANAGLGMPDAMLELAKAAGTTTPGGQFRVQFAALGQALGKGDHAGADQAGASAIAIAQENGWTHLVAAVHFALASGLLGAGKAREAVARYREVDAAGAKLEQAGDVVGTKLRLQAAFAAGAAFVSESAWPEGVQAYQAAVPLASAAGEPLMVVDAWRMAGYCHEQARDVAGAWDAGLKALQAGDAIPADQRAHSMLPFAGQGLLRIAGGSPTHVSVVEQRMAALMGTAAWQPEPPGGQP
jgi:hypothetical protein